MEDNLNPNEPFSPSLFEQAQNILDKEQYAPAPAENKPNSTTPITPAILIDVDHETAKIIVELPFEVASFLYKMEELALHDKEAEKLAKLWRGPLQRLLGQYANTDIGIAAVATIMVAVGKYAEYKIITISRDNPRNAGEGQN